MDETSNRYRLVKSQLPAQVGINHAALKEHPSTAPQLREPVRTQPAVELLHGREPQQVRRFSAGEVRRLRDAVLRANALLDARRARLERALHDAIRRDEIK
jgi:hypothetical protein